MTGQINDLFRYKGIEYAVSGISEGELFDPSSLGLHPFGACTACWRGYQAIFALADSQLVLDTLHITLGKSAGGIVPHTQFKDWTSVEGPPINGVLPISQADGASFGNNHYVGIGHRLEYTGGLLLGDGFIKELYVHRGFQAAWKYTNVVELVFEKGMLLQEFDRSEQMLEIRQQIASSRAEGESRGMPTKAELWGFVTGSLDRTYRSEWAPNKGLNRAETLLRFVGHELEDPLRRRGTHVGGGQLGQSKAALVAARAQGDRAAEAYALVELGSAYLGLSNAPRAVDCHRHALAIAREIGDRQLEGVSLGRLGGAYLRLPNLQQAKDCYEPALIIARESGDRASEANWLGGLGNVLLARVKDWQIERLRLRDLPKIMRLSRTVRQAMPLFEQAADIAHEVGDWKGEGAWLGSLGSAYHRLGRMRQAIPYYERALAIAREVGDHVNEAGWLRSLGNAYGTLKEPERALEYYEQTLALEGNAADPQSMATLLYNMGLRAKQAGDSDRARELWTCALALSESMALPIAARVRRMLAELSG